MLVDFGSSYLLGKQRNQIAAQVKRKENGSDERSYFISSKITMAVN
jgi:hypothetical protein